MLTYKGAAMVIRDNLPNAKLTVLREALGTAVAVLMRADAKERCHEKDGKCSVCGNEWRLTRLYCPICGCMVGLDQKNDESGAKTDESEKKIIQKPIKTRSKSV